MKIGLFQPGMESTAEHELSMRIALAARRLGWQAMALRSTAEIEEFQPNFVLAMHFRFPKLTEHLTFGCMWNPPEFFANTPSAVRNVLSYDGYLVGGRGIGVYLSDLNYGLKKGVAYGQLYPSCHATTFAPRDFRNATAAWIGTNWDGPRFAQTVDELSSSGLVNFFGPPGSWTHAGPAYVGSLPFDGVTILRQLHASGATICLHRPEHIRSGAPNMRVFEGVAAGSAMICDDNPFVREHFSDSVSYIDAHLPPAHLAQHILDTLKGIRAAPARAAEMAKAAHETFLTRFTFERLLQDVAETAGKLEQRSPRPQRIPEPQVDCIIRTGFRDAAFLRRALASLETQTFAGVRALVVNNRDRPEVRQVLSEYAGRLAITEIVLREPRNRSHSLWTGLAALKAPFFCILDDDDRFHPRHIESLVHLLKENSNASAAYAGAVRVGEGRGPDGELTALRQERTLAYFEPFDASRLYKADNFIASNAFLARTAALDARALEDPGFEVLEDLWLLIMLTRNGTFLESWRVTSEFFVRNSGLDNITYTRHLFTECANRIRTRLQFGHGEPLREPWQMPDGEQTENPAMRPEVAFSAQPPVQSGLSGFLDSIVQDAGQCEIVGWLPFVDPLRPPSVLIAGVIRAEVLSSETFGRKDVAEIRGDWRFYRSGFRIRFQGFEFAEDAKLKVYCRDSSGGWVRLNSSERLNAIVAMTARESVATDA